MILQIIQVNGTNEGTSVFAGMSLGLCGDLRSKEGEGDRRGVEATLTEDIGSRKRQVW